MKCILFSIFFAYIISGLPWIIYTSSHKVIPWFACVTFSLFTISFSIYVLFKKIALIFVDLYTMLLNGSCQTKYTICSTEANQSEFIQSIYGALNQAIIYIKSITIDQLQLEQCINAVSKFAHSYELNAYKSNIANASSQNTMPMIGIIFVILLFVLFLLNMKKIDDHCNKYICNYNDNLSSPVSFDVHLVFANMHQKLKQLSIAIFCVGFIGFIWYTVVLKLFGISNAVLCGCIQGFSSIIPFFGDVLSGTLITLSCIHAQIGYTKGMLCILSIVAIAFSISSIITPYVVGRDNQINIIYLLSGMIINIYIFGIFGIIFNFQICLFIHSIIKQIQYIESSKSA